MKVDVFIRENKIDLIAGFTALIFWVLALVPDFKIVLYYSMPYAVILSGFWLGIAAMKRDMFCVVACLLILLALF